MIYTASFDKKRGWRVIADYTAVGGARRDICGAVDETTARETARLMNIAAAPR